MSKYEFQNLCFKVLLMFIIVQIFANINLHNLKYINSGVYIVTSTNISSSFPLLGAVYMSPVSWEMTMLKHQQAKLGGRLKVVFKGDLFHVSEQIFSHWLKQGTQINYGAPEQG